MSVKLTLRLDPLSIKRAKWYAKKHNTSVSQLVENYFVLLQNKQGTISNQLQHLPITASLRGILKKSTVTEIDYQDYLSKKYL